MGWKKKGGSWEGELGVGNKVNVSTNLRLGVRKDRVIILSGEGAASTPPPPSLVASSEAPQHAGDSGGAQVGSITIYLTPTKSWCRWALH